MRPARWRRSAFAGIVYDGGEGIVWRLAVFEEADADRGRAIRARGAGGEDLVDGAEGAEAAVGADQGLGQRVCEGLAHWVEFGSSGLQNHL